MRNLLFISLDSHKQTSTHTIIPRIHIYLLSLARTNKASWQPANLIILLPHPIKHQNDQTQAFFPFLSFTFCLNMLCLTVSVTLSMFAIGVFRVFFRGVTWMRDSHGLFDYESRNISKKNLKTKYVGKIIRQSNTIEFVSPTTSIEDLPGYKKDEMLTLAQIKQDNSKSISKRLRLKFLKRNFDFIFSSIIG